MSADTSPAAKLLAMLDGGRVVQALYATAALGIADALGSGTKDGGALAAAVGAEAASLRRLLRALVSLGVVDEELEGRFRLTPLGALLRADVPDSLRAAVLLYGGRRHWTSWGRLTDSVRTGKPAFGAPAPDVFVEMARRDPEGAALFNDAMTALSGPVRAAVLDAYDFSRFRSVVDVGGGHGALLSSLLIAHPDLRGVLFDIAPVIDGARAPIAAAGLADRCELVAGDMFAAVPRGGDAYLLKWVVHDWDDEASVRLLTRCREAMAAHARLLIVERVVPEAGAAVETARASFLSDLNMLVLSGGRERSEAEYRGLLSAAGLDLVRIVPTTTPSCILESIPKEAGGGVSI